MGIARRHRWKKLSQERWRKRLRRERLADQKLALAAGAVPKALVRRPVLFAPPIFEIHSPENRRALMTFLANIREIAVIRGKRVTIDFSRTKRMVACGTLLFLAEVSRIAALTGHRRRVTCRRVADEKVGQVLHQIGFFDAIGRKSEIQPTADDVVYWRACSGIGAEGQKASALVDELAGRLPPSLSSPMYTGLVEAMTNCAQHAYRSPREDGLGSTCRREWWMFAQEREGRLSVLICDLGMGIPASLPLTHEPGLVRETLANLGRKLGIAFSDSDLIEAAVELGRSRTRESHRGKGLRDILDVIANAGEGTLQVSSNRGRYTYRLENGETSIKTQEYKRSVLGTLIQWQVPVLGNASEAAEERP